MSESLNVQIARRNKTIADVRLTSAMIRYRGLHRLSHDTPGHELLQELSELHDAGDRLPSYGGILLGFWRRYVDACEALDDALLQESYDSALV